ERLQLNPASRLARTAREIPVVVFCSTKADAQRCAALEERGVDVVGGESGWRDPGAVLDELHRRDVQSVLVEGGGTVAASFLEAGLVDKVSFFIAPLIIGGRDAMPSVGGKGAAGIADGVKLQDVEITRHASDVEITGYVKAATGDSGQAREVGSQREATEEEPS
ncbi:MAG: dihydrofolate reductase family protein, partial [Pyrinomonadaceae bacterium]